ncbi:hypothetical protein GCM10011335_12510 [Aureimonas glaciei]|uniref:Uncharacterized protein n=1 Tax=Aureimonas glaciei TaxID=1776957 RepID=A0A916XUE8_9HYPH|nr:hypothetical protein GCM10011335_12510 [Aureimonas glaciei]
MAATALAGLALLAPLPASAASPDAWNSFRKDVEAACRTAAAARMPEPQVVVDPFGSESYGLAFLRGLSPEDGATQSLVCIYDKKARTAEIGGTMALETAVPALAAEAPAALDAAPTAAAGAPAEPVAPAATPEAPPSPPATAVAAATPSPTAPATPSGATTPPAAPAAPSPAASSPAAPSPATPSPATPAAAAAPPTRSQAAAALEQRFLSAAAPPAAAAPVDVAAYAPSGQADPVATAFAGQCDATCAVTLTGLAEPDRASLVDLAAEVDRTLAAHPGAKLAAGPEAAREAAAALAGSAAGQKTGDVAPPAADLAGERSCVLYYFGYENQAARTVARHRCRVTQAEGGALVVEKTSGERLRAEIRPLTGEFSAFVGRTFEAAEAETAYDPAKPVSPANAELGNTVGLAAAREGKLVLVSSQRRRFADQGDFFWVLALDPV